MTQLSNKVISRFNTYASQFYEAKKENNQEKSNQIFRELGFDTHGFDTLGSGAGRIVCDMEIVGYPNLCVKFALPNVDYGGLEQNKREIEVWTDLASRDQKEMLVPIINYGTNSYWIVMKQGSTVNTLDYNWKQEAEYLLKDLVWVEDIKEENIVSLDGKQALCDYGTGPR